MTYECHISSAIAPNGSILITVANPETGEAYQKYLDSTTEIPAPGSDISTFELTDCQEN